MHVLFVRGWGEELSKMWWGRGEEALEWKEGGGEQSELEHNNCGCVYNGAVT